MNAKDLVARFRYDVDDRVDPYLWSDEEIYRYADIAQEVLVRQLGGIRDSSSQLTRVVLRAGVEFAAISPLILKLRAARRESDGRFLQLLNFEDIEYGRGPSQEDYPHQYSLPNVTYLDNRTGQPKALVLGMEPNKVRAWPIAEENTPLRLILHRLPEKRITPTQLCIEVDEIHHEHLLLWMKHMAYAKQDAETFDKGASESFRNQFMAYADGAKAEYERQIHKPRSIAYGGL